MKNDLSITHTGVILLVVLFCSACVSLKQTKQTGIKKVDQLSAFNGIYHNPADDNKSAVFSSLWSQLSLGNHLDSLPLQDSRIALTAIGEKQLKAVWFQNNEQKAIIILNGKLKNNYFVSNHKRTIIPIPLVYGKFENNQVQLALNVQGGLAADRLHNQWGWVFLFLASNDQTYHYSYQAVPQ